VRGVDLLRVGRGLHSGRVALVAKPEVGRERVGADVRALGAATPGPLVAVGDEIDLHLRVRRDNRADVAALDHDVPVLAGRAPPTELPPPPGPRPPPREQPPAPQDGERRPGPWGRCASPGPTR